jgi:Tfp pilus assembly protein PilN
MSQSPNSLSFLPDDFLRRKQQRRTNVLFTCLFVIEVAGVIAGGVIGERALRQVERENARVTLDYANAAKRIEQVRQIQQKQQTIMRQAELTQSLQENVPRSKLLAEITNAKPAGVSLLDFVMDAKKVQHKVTAKTQFEQRKAEQEAKKGIAPPPEPTIYDVTMKMTGTAASDVQVARFMTRLMQCELFKDVNLVVSEEYQQDKEKVRKFQIEMRLNPRAGIPAAPVENRTAAIDLHQ